MSTRFESEETNLPLQRNVLPIHAIHWSKR